MSADKRLQRLRFRSWHRGMREMDLVLGTFADAHLSHFGPEELDQYEALLSESDPDLYNWITGAHPPPDIHNHAIMNKLRTHNTVDPKAI